MHWKCEYCGTCVYEPSIDLRKQVCRCGKGKGYWFVEKDEQTDKAEGKGV